MGTIFHHQNHSKTQKNSSCYESDDYCKTIHKSLGMLSTLVRTLGSRTTHVERREIKGTYKAMYDDEDLLNHLQRLKHKLNNYNEDDESKLFSIKACEALLLWLCDPWERDACLAKDALERNNDNFVVDFKALIEIFVGRKSSHIAMIKQVYQTKFKKQLDQDIVSFEPPHPCQKILVALSTSHKAHNADVSQDIAKCDAIRLYQTGEACSGCINEAVVLEILSKRSIPQLKLTFSSYKRIFGHSYTKQLKKVNSTPFEDVLRNLVECVQDPPKYYAKMLQRSIRGEETMARDGTLTRVLISRGDIDMGDIQKVLRKKFGVQLKDAICQGVPAGEYRDFILALLTNNIIAN